MKIGDIVQKNIKEKKLKQKRQVHEEELNEADYQNFKKGYLKNQNKEVDGKQGDKI